MSSSATTLGQSLELEELVQLAAIQTSTVELSEQSAAGLKKNKAGRKGESIMPELDQSVFGDLAQEEPLNDEQRRASLLLLALLLQKTRVRFAVVDFVLSLFNANIPLHIPASSNAETALCMAMRGVGCIASEPDESLGQYLEQAGLQAPGLFESEEELILPSPVCARAVLALTAFASKNLLNTADATAALTCEAIQASTQPFNRSVFETNRPHKGDMQSAENLSLLTDGSGLANKRKGKQADVFSISCIPQYHGPARDMLENAQNTMKIEINACEAETDLKMATPLLKVASAFDTAIPLLATGASARINTTVLGASLYSLPDMLKGTKANTEAGMFPLQQEATIALDRIYSISMRDTRVGAAAQASSSISASSSGSGPEGAVQLYLAQVANSTDDSQLNHVEVEPMSGAMLAYDMVTQLSAILAIEALVSAHAIRARQEEHFARYEAAMQKKAAAEAKLAEKREKEAAANNDGSTGGAKANNKNNKKQKAKKKGKEMSPDITLGAGTAVVLKYLQQGSKVGLDDAELQDQLFSVRAKLNPLNVSLDTWLSAVLTTNTRAIKPKVAKGVRDFLPFQMAIREKAFNTITQVFKRHGGVTIDTPVFERKDILTGKYGEDSKLIYDLADQGGEILALRYDLTVPFARYLAIHSVGNIKRYHIAKVYRRDNPAMKRGRFREFYQCDFDVAGEYEPMIPDAEVLKILSEILDELAIGNYVIKLNHRKLLDGMLHLCGVPEDKTRPICSAIDKLDKEPWEAVRAEMVDQKGLDPEVADRIETFVTLKDEPRALYNHLVDQGLFADSAMGKEALADLDLLFTYCDFFGMLDKISFDLSLARGLDYYTGVIYEAVFTETNQVGSIAAGGRYDKLVGMFNSGGDIPAVGVSIGIERIFAIMEQKMAENPGAVREVETEVLVASIGNDMLEERMRVCKILWDAKIKAEFVYKKKLILKKQLDYASSKDIPFVVVFGDDELANGTVKVKQLSTAGRELTEEEKEELEVKRDGEMVSVLSEWIATWKATLDNLPTVSGASSSSSTSSE